MDPEDDNRVSNVRRSRAERARLEIGRRHRSSSRGSDRGSNSNSSNSRDKASDSSSLKNSTASSNDRGHGRGHSSTGMHSSSRGNTASDGGGSARNSNRDSYRRNVNDHSSYNSNSMDTSSSMSNNMSNSVSINRNKVSSPIRSRLDKYEKKGVRPATRTNDLSPTSRMIRQQEQHKQNQYESGSGSRSGIEKSAESIQASDQSQGQVQGRGMGTSGQEKGAQRTSNPNQHDSYSQPGRIVRDGHQREQQQQQQQQQQQNPNNAQHKFTNYQQHQANQVQQKHQHQHQHRQRDASKVMQTQTRQRPSNVSVSTKQTSAGSISPGATPTSLPFTVNPNNLSSESPLPPLVQRALGDRSYEKRKNAALEVEAMVKSLAETAANSNSNGNANSTSSEQHKMISSLIHILSKDFCPSMNVHFRKGGLIGLAATAIGLMPQQLTSAYLEFLIQPVLICFDDPEPRVRYYACESLYNIIKVARESVLPYFNIIFEGVATVLADTDDEVREGANLLDRLVKDIVTECEAFSVEKFLPLLQNYIRRTNPFLRNLVVSWITVLDGIPDVCMIDYLPDFLDGLFNMLSDSSLDIRQAADSALSNFLKELIESRVVEFGPIISILVFQCMSKERLNRLTSITWLSELIHHPNSGGDALLPFHAEVLGAILHCISDQEIEIRKVSERSNSDLLNLVRETNHGFELRILLETLTKELTGKDDVPTKMAVLRWINMLLEKRRRAMDEYISQLMPALLQLLSDQSDGVVLLTVQVLSRISLSGGNICDEVQFKMVIKSILALFKADRRLLETRGSLIVRRLCVLLNAKSVYLIMSEIISSYDLSAENGDSFTLEFVATMVQTLNLILLTASELNNLRQLLENSFTSDGENLEVSSRSSAGRYQAKNEGAAVFAALFHCWSNNPVSTFSLCLLARAYDLAFALVKKFSELEVTVGLLMQLDRLIGLIESPIFVHIRLQLLDVEAPYHTYLLKSCYGLLMLLPQSDAYRSLNDRLTSVCNLRDNLGVRPNIIASSSSSGTIRNENASIYSAGLDASDLLGRFDEVMTMHRKARSAIQQKLIVHQQQDHMNERKAASSNLRVNNAPNARPDQMVVPNVAPPLRQR